MARSSSGKAKKDGDRGSKRALKKGKSDKGGVGKSSSDAFQLTIDYVKQETLQPLKSLGRFIVWGLLGSIALAVGLALLLLAGLRALQSETGSAFTNHLSWLPYAISTFAALIVLILAAWRIMSGPAKRKLPHEEGGSEQ